MPLLMNSCVAGAANSTSHVTMPITAPCWMSCSAQVFWFFSWWLQSSTSAFARRRRLRR